MNIDRWLMIATITMLLLAWAWLAYVYPNHEPYTIPEAHSEAYATLCPIGSVPLVSERAYSSILTGHINLTPTETIQALNCCQDQRGNTQC